MADHHVCPWWLGYLLVSPLRRLEYNPGAIVAPYVREGMTALEPGPGMGFFTVELARRVGPSGRVIAPEVQPKMLRGLKRRLAKAGLLERVDVRFVSRDSLGLDDLAGSVDFTLAFAVVHELPAPDRFFAEVAKASKPGACLLLAEPTGHVKPRRFESGLKMASQAGFDPVGQPPIRHSLTALLKKSA
ncbi:MAG TPA: methyltransferase domain-containing protein [Terriglobia bacterium]|nr:methyltransferase domain-containing protein [Terriglobia bacterium]